MSNVSSDNVTKAATNTDMDATYDTLSYSLQ